MATRAELRNQLFSQKRFKTEKITLFGVEVEIRQPSLGQILSTKDETDRKKVLLQSLIEYCYVPGTEERVFEEGDLEEIMQLPLSEDINNFNKAIERLSGINVELAAKNSKPTTGGTVS